jgi:hypothetical protein
MILEGNFMYADLFNFDKEEKFTKEFKKII